MNVPNHKIDYSLYAGWENVQNGSSAEAPVVAQSETDKKIEKLLGMIQQREEAVIQREEAVNQRLLKIEQSRDQATSGIAQRILDCNVEARKETTETYEHQINQLKKQLEEDREAQKKIVQAQNDEIAKIKDDSSAEKKFLRDCLVKIGQESKGLRKKCAKLERECARYREENTGLRAVIASITALRESDRLEIQKLTRLCDEKNQEILDKEKIISDLREKLLLNKEKESQLIEENAYLNAKLNLNKIEKVADRKHFEAKLREAREKFDVEYELITLTFRDMIDNMVGEFRDHEAEYKASVAATFQKLAMIDIQKPEAVIKWLQESTDDLGISSDVMDELIEDLRTNHSGSLLQLNPIAINPAKLLLDFLKSNTLLGKFIKNN
jgi:chromosome segregation ATPase